MRPLLTIASFLLATSLSWASDFKPCRFGATVSVSQTPIEADRLTILDDGKMVAATALMPNAPGPLPGIIFSHSEIQGFDTKLDFLRFATGLAEAGAAVIVVDGTIDWRTPNDASEISPHLWACAGQWLLTHANLDRKRLAEAGPNRHWGGGDTPRCMEGESPCWSGRAWLNFGQTSSAEFANTDRMLREGLFGSARFFEHQLKLRAVGSEWLGVEKLSP